MQKPSFFVNIQSGFTVSLISIPLSIALVTASGGTPLQGILAAIYACAVAGFTGGSNYNIFGPAGALTALLATFVMSQGGDPFVLPIVALAVGCIVGLIYFLRIGKYMTLIPSTALHGFIAGVGLTIATGQLNNIFGIASLVTKHSEMTENLLETYYHIGATNSWTVIVFAVGFVFLLFWPKLTKKVPAPIPLTVLGVVLGLVGTRQGRLTDMHIATIKTAYKGMEFAFADFGYFGLIHDIMSGAKPGFISALLSAASVIAVIAVLETIISAKIADGMTKTKHNTQKEIRGLALANIASGLLGGVPATGVFVRTALNIKSGANSRTSAVATGVSVLIISLLLFNYFVYVPMPVISAILVSIAVKLLDIKVRRKVRKYDSKSLWVMIMVALVTRLTDPMYGIVLGTVVALMIHIVHLTSEALIVTIMRDGQFHAKKTIADYVDEQTAGDLVIVKLAGEINFMNIGYMVEQLELLQPSNTLIVSCRSVTDMDVDAMEQFEHFINAQIATGRDVRLCSLSEHLTDQLSKTVMYQTLKAYDAVYVSTASAI